MRRLVNVGVTSLSLLVFGTSSTASEVSRNMSQHKHDHSKHPFKNAEEFAAKFDDPSRDEWQKPDEILDFIELKPSYKFADFGAGTGYFSIRAAKRVKEGVVFAIDSEPEMLRYIQKRAASAGLSNIKTFKTNHHLALPERVDVILLVNTYHHIENRVSCFSDLKRWLNADGKLVVIEGKPGTPMEPPEEIRVTRNIIETELAQAGYAQSDEASFLPYQSLQIFKLKPLLSP